MIGSLIVMWPKCPGHPIASWLHVEHFTLSIDPIRGSYTEKSPVFFALVISRTDIFKMSLLDKMPNCILLISSSFDNDGMILVFSIYTNRESFLNSKKKNKNDSQFLFLSYAKNDYSFFSTQLQH